MYSYILNKEPKIPQKTPFLHFVGKRRRMSDAFLSKLQILRVLLNYNCRLCCRMFFNYLDKDFAS